MLGLKFLRKFGGDGTLAPKNSLRLVGNTQPSYSGSQIFLRRCQLQSEPVVDHAPFDLGLVQSGLELLDLFGQIRARNDILVVAVTLSSRVQIILTQLIIFPLDEIHKWSRGRMQIPQYLLKLVIAGPFISQMCFQQSVLVQHRLLGVYLIEQVGEQIRHLLATWNRDWINTRVGEEDLGTRLRSMVRGRIRRPRRGDRRIGDRRIRLYNIRRVRIRRPYIEEEWIWVEGQRVGRIPTG